jgi:hypothetical protein
MNSYWCLGCSRVGVVTVSVAIAGSLANAQTPPGPRTRTIHLAERAGIERQQFPVEVTVRLEKGTKPANVRLFRRDGDRRVPVPFQVLAAGADFRGVAGPMAQTFVRLALLADLPAGGTAAYDLALDGEPPGPWQRLARTPRRSRCC